MENFNLANIQNLSPVDAKIYIDKYFIPLDNGSHAILKNGKYEIMDTTTLRSVYFNRMSGALKQYYFNEKLDIRSLIYDINKPILSNSELNLCSKVMHVYKEYKTFSKDEKEGTQIMLDHIKNIWCNGDLEVYKHTIKWISNMIKGNKNDCCIYLKGPQGSGKTTPVEFIRFHVLGIDLCVETGSGPLKTKFNSELGGKLMVQFEELENFSSSEWISISSVLKRIITSKTIMIEGKGKDAVEHKNINNYFLLSNNDAITDDEGRRYFILPVNTKVMGNSAYFDDLYKKCFNDKVGHCFYCYMMEVDLTNYYAQKYPITSSKKDSFVKRLDSVYKFLKETFILKSLSVERIKVNDLYLSYVEFCEYDKSKAKGKIDFCNTLKNIGFEYKKSNSSNYYRITLDELKEKAEKFNWIHELDDMKVKEPIKTMKKDIVLNKKDYFSEKVPEIKRFDMDEQYQRVLKIDKLRKEINRLKISELQNEIDRLNNYKPTPKPKHIFNAVMAFDEFLN